MRRFGVSGLAIVVCIVAERKEATGDGLTWLSPFYAILLACFGIHPSCEGVHHRGDGVMIREAHAW
jgi:hypothetical protein